MRTTLCLASLLGASLFVLSPASAQDDDDDVGAAREGVCCGLNCCNIEGTCFGNGDTNPANACEACTVSSSRSAWTAIPGCGDAGPAVDAGSAAEDAGTAAEDAGAIPPPQDAGTTPVDSGTPPPRDAGSTPPMDAGVGGGEDGGCAVSPGRAGSAPLLAVLGALALLWRRRLS